MMNVTITREQYGKGECTHEEYFGQFVTEPIKTYVCRVIGEQRIMDSFDPHFNDIPLREWDRLSPQIATMIDRDKLREAEGWRDPKTFPWSLSTAVCIAKQAARIIKEG